MSKGILRNQRGFTLVELLAVMVIIGVLAAIVIPTISGTREKGIEATVKEGAFTVQGASGDFFASQTKAELITPVTRSVNADINDDTDTDTLLTQKISSRWPEQYITSDNATTSAYAIEFRTATSTTGSMVRKINITDLDGDAVSRSDLFTGFTAVDFGVLTGETAAEIDERSSAFLAKKPSEVDSTTQGLYHDFLWLLKKSTSSSGSSTGDSRSLSVFKLVKVVQDEGQSQLDDESWVTQVVLTYEQVF